MTYCYFLLLGYPEYLSIAKYSPNDAPDWAPGNGRSFVDLTNLKIYISCENANIGDDDGGSRPCTNSLLDVLIFEEPTGLYTSKFSYIS